MKQKFFVLSLIIGLAASQLFVSACKGSGDFKELTEADMIAFANTLPEPQMRQLAQNPTQRKSMIDQFKKMFGLAQAAIAEGLDKGEDYAKPLELDKARVLAMAHAKRNEGFQVAKTDIDAYVAAHQKDFDNDLAYVTKNSKQTPDQTQLDQFKAQWGELQVRAEKARQAGLEKDPGVQIQLKFQRGNLLANLYSRKLDKQFEITEADKTAYFTQNPDAHPDKVQAKVAALLERIKQGETFEKIADEVNEDGTKGQGGDLGWFGKGAMDPDFEKAAFALKAGEISQAPVKSSFGFHLIKVVERRKAQAKPATPPGTVGSSMNEVAGAQNADPNAEEVHGKHIYIGTRGVEEALSAQQQEKIKRASEDVSLKYLVKVPADFALKVEGLRPATGPLAPGGGDAGSMKMIDPNANK